MARLAAVTCLRGFAVMGEGVAKIVRGEEETSHDVKEG